MPRKTEQPQKCFSRAKDLFPGGVNSPVRAFKSVGSEPFIVSHGSGPYLFDLDGNRYVDYINSWGPLVLGHAHPEVVKAINTQIEKGSTYGACSKLEVELAEEVIKLMPNIEMLRFVNSGTEAGMSVIRLARGFTGKTKIVKFKGCYHGHVDALLVQAGSGVATLGIPECAGVLADVASHTITAQYNDFDSVEEIFKKYPNDIAAVILEPVVGNSGLIVPEPAFLKNLREITKTYNSLLIFDEVMTGFRVHLGGAQTLYNIKPDLSMLGKVIGGGLPVGAFGGRKDIMSQLAPLGPVYQAGTLSGNPLAMASGIATLKEWSKGDTFENTARAAKTLIQAMREIAGSNKIDFVADSIGTMFGFFFQKEKVHNLDEAKKSDIDRFKKFFHLMLDSGVYFAPSQFEAGFMSNAHHGEALEYTIKKLEENFSKL